MIQSLKQICLEQININEKINLFLLYEDLQLIRSKSFKIKKIKKYNPTIKINNQTENFELYIIKILDYFEDLSQLIYIYININYKILLIGNNEYDDLGYTIIFKKPIILSKINILDISKPLKEYDEYKESSEFMKNLKNNEDLDMICDYYKEKIYTKLECII